MSSIVAVNPFRCRLWAMHDRLEAHVSESSCRAEIESFLERGQLVPVLGRQLHGDPDFSVELIYGARRLFVARHLNKELLVEIRNMTDREAVIAMDIENRQRVDVSPYERGLSYTRFLRSGQFPSQDDLARALRISSSQISRLVRVAQLPAAVVNAFRSPTEICERWGLDIIDALEDGTRRQAILQKARSLAVGESRPPANEVYRELIAAAAPGRKPRPKGRDEVICGSRGNPIFRIRHQTNAIAILLPMSNVSSSTLNSISSAITDIMDRPGSGAVREMRPRRTA